MKKIVIGVALAAMLTACGGGGSANNAADTVALNEVSINEGASDEFLTSNETLTNDTAIDNAALGNDTGTAAEPANTSAAGNAL
ncbi:MAG TPA: hypothetical protein VF695_01880 [Sphingomonas sp.]|jgi:hypothetical protein